MNYMKVSCDGTVEILASDVFKAIPIKVQPNGIVKAGTPLKADGSVTTGNEAYGILLYDVDTNRNRNGALIVSGLVDTVKAQRHSGITYDMTALKASVPGITFRQTSNTEESSLVGTAVVGKSKAQ